MTHLCVSKQDIIGSYNGLSPVRRQAIIWANVGILLTGPLGTNFSEISSEILNFLLKKMQLNMSSAKWWLFCIGHVRRSCFLNVYVALAAITGAATLLYPYLYSYLFFTLILYVESLQLIHWTNMGLLPGTQYCGLRMRGKCRERFPHHR